MATPTDPGYRTPWKAGLLTFLCPGLGQVYNGQLARGLLFIGLTLLLPLGGAYLARSGFMALVLFTALYFASSIYFFYDAVREAGRLGTVVLRDFQRADTYIGLVIAFSAAGYFLGNVYPVESFHQQGQLMFPGLRNGDRLLADRLAFRGRAPERGELAVFRAADDVKRLQIGRIIGLPGDTVEIRNRKVVLNGKELERNPLSADRLFPAGLGALEDEATRSGLTFEEETIESRHYAVGIQSAPAADTRALETVPEGQLFILSDQRDAVEDSRKWGFLPMENLTGKPLYVLMSIDPDNFFVRWTRFGREVR